MTGLDISSVRSNAEFCDHRGWALWLNGFSWWCGNCGALGMTGYNSEVKLGDVVNFI